MLKNLAKLFHSGPRLESGMKTDMEFLGSQGSRTSKDLSASFLHASTSPPNYYKYTYGTSSINMDRGGFGHAKNGTNYGCIFDGVTCGGKINAYAAQAFTDFFMHWLAEHHALFCFSSSHSIIDLAREAFQEATLAANNPGSCNPACQAEGGSATGVIVAFDRRSDDLAVLHGASIGDAAAISVRIRDELACQLNPVFRKYERDTGGQITMCLGVDGPVWCFSVEVNCDEFVILATDGLTDNIYLPELDRIIPLIMRARLFDGLVPFECESISNVEPEKPTYMCLHRLTKSDLEILVDVTCEVATRRLFHYLEWVTRFYFNLEEQFYKLSLQAREATDEATRQALLSEVEKITADRKKTKKVVKTDDSMIIVMKPFHSSA